MAGKKTWSKKLLSVALCASMLGSMGAVTPAMISGMSITVSAAASDTVLPTGIRLSKTTLTLTKGGTSTLTATVTPSNAADKTVRWTSANEKVAKVVNGKVTAVGAGRTIIAARTANGKRVTCTVIVKSSVVNPTGIKLSKTSLTLTEGGTSTLTATVTPSNATNKTVRWTSANEKVAKVVNGKVTAVGAGRTIIAARTANGKRAACTVIVKSSAVNPTGIKLSKTSLTLTKGGTSTLTATVTPSNATNKTVKWTSANEKVAKVVNGKVTAVGTGRTVIAARTVNGKRAACTVIVKNPVVNPTGVKLSKTSLTIEAGKSAALTAAVTPSNATDKTVTWESSNENVATVLNGSVYAHGEGTAVISAKTVNGKKAVCTVKVTPNTSAILGEWEMTLDTSMLGAEDKATVEQFSIVFEYIRSYLYFDSNGKLTITMEAQGKRESQYGTYTFDGKTIKITGPDGNPYEYKFADDRIYAEGAEYMPFVRKSVLAEIKSTKKQMKSEAAANNGVIDLRVWCSEDQIETLRKQAEEFKNIYADDAYSFNIKFISVSSDTAGSKILNNSGSAADVFLVNSDMIPTLAKNGKIAKVSAENAAALSKSMTKKSMDSVKYNNTVYAYPAYYGGYYLIYDKRYISESDTKTLDQLMSKAAAKGKNVYFDAANSYYLASFLFASGVKLVNSENGTHSASIYSQQGFNAFKALCSYASGSGILMNPGAMGDNAYILQGFSDGTLAAAVTGGWMSKSIEGAIGANNVGYAKLPTAMINGSQKQLHSFGDTVAYCINAKSTAPASAQAFAAFLTSQKSLKYFASSVTPEVTLKTASAKASVKAITAQMPYSHGLETSVGDWYWTSGINALGSTIVNQKGNVEDDTIWAYLDGIQNNIN